MTSTETYFTAAEIAGWIGCPLRDECAGRRFRGGGSLQNCGPCDISYMDHPSYVSALRSTAAGACIVSPRFAKHVPDETLRLVVPDPYRAYAVIMGRFYPEALRPAPDFDHRGISPLATVHPSASIGQDVTIEPGATVGAGATLGDRVHLGCNAVVGQGVAIGRDSSIGAGCTVKNATVGDRAILHPGVRIGQDGFGFAMGAGGHLKMVQLGGVIVGDDVEIGANTTVDRGSLRDTVIGDGTKIDNLVQVAHNVQIGRHCVIVAQTGIAGSTTIEDYVAIGGQSAVAGHLTVGQGAQLAASSRLMRDVPPGERWGGMPAKPLREWFREQVHLQKIAKRSTGEGRSEQPDA